MKRDIHILMHTHWDREWYFTKDETHVLLIYDMIEVIQFLQAHPSAKYVLDGQAIMLDDFLKFAPEYKEQLVQLVKRGQLKIGPWYTQTDLRLVHGESIIRNLYYGHQVCAEFGDVMKVGYAPDTFGHSAQMPQIYQMFGIHSTFFWRGLSTLKAKYSDFIWQGLDGSKITGINLATGYQGAKYLEHDASALQVRMQKIMKVLDAYSVSENRLIMNGHDQMPIQKDIYTIIENMQKLYPNDTVHISSFEAYLKGLENVSLEVVEDDLVDAQHARIHRTISSTRMDIKILVKSIEHSIYSVLEPLSILATKVNIKYPHEMIAHCLKELFGIHAHDSMGGCNGDSVNQDIKQRLLNVKELVDYQILLMKRVISESCSKQTITIYNLLPYKRYDTYVDIELQTYQQDFTIFDDNGEEVSYQLLSQTYIDAGMIDRQVAARQENKWVYISKIRVLVQEIDGLCVRYYTFKEGGTKSQENNEASFIENEFYKIYVEDTLILEVKQDGRIIRDFISIESGADAGDSYDYSPPIRDITYKIDDIEVLECHEHAYVKQLKLRVKKSLPHDLSARMQHDNQQTVIFDIVLQLQTKDENVYIEVEHTNVIKDNRYRLVVHTEGYTTTHRSDGIHSSQIRKNVNEAPLAHWIEDRWVEKPVSIEPFHSYITNTESEYPWTIYSRSLNEYEVVDKHVYITLMRSFSHLGKSDLVNRPGRPSGIPIRTDDNQMIGQKMTWDVAICFISVANVATKAMEYISTLKSYQCKYFHRFNINQPSYKKIDSTLNLAFDSLRVVACKQSKKGQTIIRVVNDQVYDQVIKLKDGVYLSNVFEEKLDCIKELKINSQEIKTLLIEEDNNGEF